VIESKADPNTEPRKLKALDPKGNETLCLDVIKQQKE
jgi:hypothetical protein